MTSERNSEPHSAATRRGSDSTAAGVTSFETLRMSRFKTPRGASASVGPGARREYCGVLCSESLTRGNVFTAPPPQTLLAACKTLAKEDTTAFPGSAATVDDGVLVRH